MGRSSEHKGCILSYIFAVIISINHQCLVITLRDALLFNHSLTRFNYFRIGLMLGEPEGELNDEALTWINALERRARRLLSSEERVAIASLPLKRRRFAAGDHLSREGDPPLWCAYVLDGALYQTKLTSEGDRQIVGLRLKHEFVGLGDMLLQTMSYDVQALTACQLLQVDVAQLRTIMARHPGIAEILSADAMISCSIALDWIVNVGRRNARTRVAHLLCELALRIEGGALSPGARYILPLTQLQLGDAVGLGRIAVNRVMHDLARVGVASCGKSCITILDPAKLEEIGDFTARYLHLAQSERERRKSNRDKPGAPIMCPEQQIPSRA